MSKLDSVISRFPPGSGRKMDYTWPDWNANNSNGGAVTNQIRDRPGAQAADPAGSLSAGTSGSFNVGVVNGVSCVRLVNGINLGGGPVANIDGAGRLHLNTLKTNTAYTTATDDYSVNRAYAIMRVTATPADATDCGFQFVLGGNASLGVLFSGVPGWSLQFDTTGNCSLTQRGNSGALVSTVLARQQNGFVNTDFHTFEFRFANATPFVDGAMRILLDGSSVLAKSFGSSADDLPLPTSPGGNANNGYIAHVINNVRNHELDVALVRIIRAPFEGAI